MDTLTAFGRNVKIVRTKRGYTQEALATAAQIDRSYLGEIERGLRNPSLEILTKLCRTLDCSLNDLVEVLE